MQNVNMYIKKRKNEKHWQKNILKLVFQWGMYNFQLRILRKTIEDM